MIAKIVLSADIGYRHAVTLQGVNTTLSSGNCVVIVGVNGVGKTTLLATLAGILKPTTGSILYDGLEANNEQLLGEVGFVSDQPNFYEELTVVEHVELIQSLWDGKRPVRTFAELDSGLRLSDFMNVSAGDLSRGQRQRLAIALTMIPSPSVLLLDEPFNALDLQGVRQLRLIAKLMVQEGGIVVISTHLIETVAPIANRVLILKDSSLVADSEVNENDLSRVVERWYDAVALES